MVTIGVLDPEQHDRLQRLRELVADGVVNAQAVDFLLARDALPRLVRELPQAIDAKSLEAWQVAGLFLVRGGRAYDGIAVFEALYEMLLERQVTDGARIHKGMPLVWIRDAHVNLDHTALAQRFIMLTLIEDAIYSNGEIDPYTTGSYFRLVWYHGMSDKQFRQYARDSADFARSNELATRYPERVLQELDQLWMTAFPSTAEALLYPANRRYVAELLNQTGDKAGTALELLAQYLLSVMPGCRTYRRKRSYSTDYDIVCSLDGFDLDFRSELGRYFVSECKDWNEPADFAAFAKFARVLDSTKSRFGILFSREGITGERLTRNAAREQLKLFQDRGIVIVVVTRRDIEAVIEGYNFIALLRDKYERVRLDLLGEHTETAN